MSLTDQLRENPEQVSFKDITVIDDLWLWVQEGLFLRNSGHDTFAWHSNKNLLLGWADATTGKVQAVRLNLVKLGMSDPERLPVDSLMREQAQKVYDQPWEKLGLTWKRARELIKTHLGRAILFDKGRTLAEEVSAEDMVILYAESKAQGQRLMRFVAGLVGEDVPEPKAN